MVGQILPRDEPTHTSLRPARANGATFDQARASDQCRYYQSKSIKQNLYGVARDQLPKASEAPDSATARQLEGFNAKLAKYEQDKNQIQADAKKLEEQRDQARQG